MSEIITIGEILVEIMAANKGQRFDEVGSYEGPYPSGAPAIFTNQAAKIGSKSKVIATIGDDMFGELNYNKLIKDNVDVTGITKTKKLSTGVAFVTYKEDGERDFIFHLNNSAAGLINEDSVQEEDFEDCNYFHIMGTSLFNAGIRSAVRKAIKICKEKHIKISFDPNIRKELIHDQEAFEFLKEITKACDIFLPGEDELEYFTSIADPLESAEYLIAQGMEYVVIKQGSKGCVGVSNESKYEFEPIKVKEIDPTGAGDCFAGTLISCLNQGKSFKDSVELANIAGAHAVTKRGPMEGNATLEQLENFRMTT